MRKALMLPVFFFAISAVGCKKSVPQDILLKTLKGAMSQHSPATTSAMCGLAVKGIPNATITVTTKKPDNTGVAHIRGTPWGGRPAFCEGDVEFKYTFTSKTTGYKRKTTTTTWYLEHVKLVGVQTPGVANVTADENPDGDDE